MNPLLRLRPFFDRRLWTVPRHLLPEQRERCLAFLRSEIMRVDSWQWTSNVDIWEELSVRAERDALNAVFDHLDAAADRCDGRPVLRSLLWRAERLRDCSYSYAGNSDAETAYLFKREAGNLVDLVQLLVVVMNGRGSTAEKASG